MVNCISFKYSKRYNIGGAGSGSPAALAFWWRRINKWIQQLQNQWNGSSWTEVNDLNTARHLLGTSGTKHLL